VVGSDTPAGLPTCVSVLPSAETVFVPFHTTFPFIFSSIANFMGLILVADNVKPSGTVGPVGATSFPSNLSASEAFISGMFQMIPSSVRCSKPSYSSTWLRNLFPS